MSLLHLADPFPVEDIEWRLMRSGVGGQGSPWGQVAAYIGARAVQDRLDAVCDPGGWFNQYRDWHDFEVEIQIRDADGKPRIHNGLYEKRLAMCNSQLCGISVKCGSEWVTKWDGAECSYDREVIKGGLSNAFRRAAVQWGIGRYLYHLPSPMWAKCSWEQSNDASLGWANGKKFFWLPPELPKWALPDAQKESEGQKEPAPF